MIFNNTVLWLTPRSVTVFSLHRSPWSLFLGIFLLVGLLVSTSPAAQAKTVRLSILMVSDARKAPVDGLKDALLAHAAEEGHTFIYEIKNAAGDRSKLAGMAAEIIAEKPDVAIAGGGVEADALLAASAGTNIPVVFLSVSSSVDRGIVAGMTSSANNFTGIDTNDTQLTAKRLWFIRKILPDAQKVFCFHSPSIVPSGKSLAVARQSAIELGFEVQVAEVESEADLKKAITTLSRATTDVILLLATPLSDQALRPILLPRALEENIPIFGYGQTTVENGAFASYSGSRYANGRQAARLIHKILAGTAPKEIPIETPEKLELIINKALVAKLGMKLPARVWRMADQIVDIQF
ncbi:MAG: ABC transporter substrate-binding protein [Pseudomonadota bacterium]